MNKTIFFLVLFIAIKISVLSQTFNSNIHQGSVLSPSDSKRNLQLAISAYQNNEFKLAVDYFTFYQESIKKEPNLIKNELQKDSNIQFMFISACIKIDYWERAKAEVKNFYLYFKKSQTPLYFQIRKDELLIDEMLLKEEEVYINAINKKSIKLINSYLLDFPYGKYRQILKDSSDSYTEYLNWCNCHEYTTYNICKAYIDKYTNGKYIDSVNYVLNEIEEKAFQIILKEKERDLFLSFMERYPQSKHYNEVKQQFKSFLYTQSLNMDLKSMTEYVKLFPGDKDAFVVDSLIQVYYIEKANTCYKDRDYGCADDLYNYYLEKYSNGFFKDLALSRVAKSKVNNVFIGEKKFDDFDHWFFMFNMDSDPSYGFTIGRLTSAKFSPFYNFRIRRVSSEPEIVYNDGRNSSKFRQIIPAGRMFQEVIAYSFGVKYKPLNYPVWIYATIGAGQYRDVSKYACYTQGATGNILDSYNYFQHGSPIYKGYMEVGFIAAISKIVTLKYGVMYNGKLNHQFGIGFIITKKSMQEFGSCINPANCCENPFSGCSLNSTLDSFNKL